MSDGIDYTGTVSQTEYARMCGVSQTAIWRGVRAGTIPARPDGRVLVDAANETWLRRQEQRSQARQETAAAELRRENALLQSTLAKIAMTRRRTAQLRAKLTERDAGQAAISALIEQLLAALPHLADTADPADAELLRKATAIIIADLGDLHAEALRVMQRE